MIKFKLSLREFCEYSFIKWNKEWDKIYIKGLSSLEEIGSETVIFVFNPSAFKVALKSDVKAIVLNRSFYNSSFFKSLFKGEKLIIPSEDVKFSFLSFLKFLEKKQFLKRKNEKIDLGKNITIYPNVYIEEGVKIGDNVIIYPNVYICGKTKIGENVVIEAGVKIGFQGFSYYYRENEKYIYKIPHIGGVEVGNSVYIGANTTIDRAVINTTFIGSQTKIDNQVHIGHNVKIGSFCYIAAHTTIGGSTFIGNHVQISGHVAIVDHVKIEDGVKIFAHSLVTKSVGKFKKIWGMPARDIRFEKKNGEY